MFNLKDISKIRLDSRRSTNNPLTIDLSIADSDFATPSFITKHIASKILKGDFAYTRGEQILGPKIKWFLDARYQVKNLEANNLTYAKGIISILQAAINLHTEVNDYIMVPNPVYGPFMKIINLQKRKIIYFDASKKKLDFKNINNKIKKYNIKLLFFCQPNNPTGKLANEKEMKKLITSMKQNNGYIYSDEAWLDLIFEQKLATSFARLNSSQKSNVISISSPGKGFILQALRFAYAYSYNDKLIADLAIEIKKNDFPSHKDVLSLAAIEIVYSKMGLKWLDFYSNLLYQNYLLIKEGLINSKIKIPAIDGTQIVLLDFTQINLNHDQIRDKLEELNLILSDGLAFGDNGLKQFRLNLSTTQNTLKKVLKRLNSIKAFNE